MEIIKTVESVELKDATIRKKNKELMRKLGETGYSTDKSDRFKLTTLFHKLISKYVEKRKFDHDYKREIRFAHRTTELHDGTSIAGIEYEQFYTRVTCYVKSFTLLGAKFSLQYEVYVPSFSQLRINKRLTPIPTSGRERTYHIGNRQVDKEEYEAYKANK